jgi:hypothetical protein
MKRDSKKARVARAEKNARRRRRREKLKMPGAPGAVGYRVLPAAREELPLPIVYGDPKTELEFRLRECLDELVRMDGEYTYSVVNADTIIEVLSVKFENGDELASYDREPFGVGMNKARLISAIARGATPGDLIRLIEQDAKELVESGVRPDAEHELTIAGLYTAQRFEEERERLRYEREQRRFDEARRRDYYEIEWPMRKEDYGVYVDNQPAQVEEKPPCDEITIIEVAPLPGKRKLRL